MRVCKQCGKPLTSNKQQKFCSRKCRSDYYYNEQLSNPYFKEAAKKTKPKADFYDVVTGALEEGISYGNYVAKHGL